MISPLSNRTIISTRPQHLAKEFAHAVEKAGGSLLHLPMINTVGLDLSSDEKNLLLQTDKFDWITFSSQNGVKFFIALVERLGLSIDIFKKVKVAAIGPATKKLLQKEGINVSYTDKEGTGESFGNALNKLITSECKILIIKGKIANEELEKCFTNSQHISRLNLYDTILPAEINEQIVQKIQRNDYDLIFFSSPSGFNNFVKLVGKQVHLDALKIACIGPSTASTVKSQGFFPHLECTGPSVEQVIESFEIYFTAN